MAAVPVIAWLVALIVLGLLCAWGVREDERRRRRRQLGAITVAIEEVGRAFADFGRSVCEMVPAVQRFAAALAGVGDSIDKAVKP